MPRRKLTAEELQELARMTGQKPKLRLLKGGRPRNDPQLPSGVGEKILRLIARYHLLTAEQLARIYPCRLNNFAYPQLKLLVDRGYLRFVESQIKGVLSVWILTEKGRHHLAGQGIAVDTRIHHLPPHSLHMAHRIAVNDVLLAFDLLSQIDDRFQVLEMANESTLSRHSTKVTLSTGQVMGYAPDAWIHFSVNGKHGALILELDRGTEEQKVWRRKVDAIISFVSGKPSLYEQRFGVPWVTVAVLAVPGYMPIEQRAKLLHDWTQIELQKLGKETWGKLFKVRPAIPFETHPIDLFAGLAWTTPGSDELTPLIGGLL